MHMYEFVGEEEIMRKNEALAKEVYTTEYLENLPEHVRAELIDGRIYFMDPPKIVHQKLAGELFFQLRSHKIGRAHV